jgi:ABC-type polysaccharide/polyol phosphate transport system ATPase subunit
MPEGEKLRGAAALDVPLRPRLLPHASTQALRMAPQFIYVMKALKKVIPPSRIILDDIWLSFYPGAKIGVLGPNGAGKSSLLRIMAGVDTEFQGEAL